MGWFDGIFGDGDDSEPNDRPSSRDPFGRIESDPVFDAFRSAWKAGAGLFELFGDAPVKIRQPVGPEAPNRRPDVARVETFLGRTGHLDLGRTDGPTGYYGGRVDHSIRGFQKDNALKIDGLINRAGRRSAHSASASTGSREQPRSAIPAWNCGWTPVPRQNGCSPSGGRSRRSRRRRESLRHE
jgi:peptidoglycan hydrolase-like protein with peptidoglycan-binding domain